jgi:hypothetical protein
MPMRGSSAFSRACSVLREHRAAVAEGDQPRQVPARGLALQRLDQRQRHGVADDGQDVDAVAHDDVPDMLGIEARLVVDHHRVPGQQADQRGPHRRAVHHGCGGEVGQRPALRYELGQFLRALDRRAAEVDAAAAQRGHQDGLVRPHHALGHAGGAAGAEHVDVVVGAVGVVSSVAARRDQRLVGQHARGGAALPTRTSVLSVGTRGKPCGDLSLELGAVDQRPQLERAEQVGQFVGDVAVVHVDRCGADLAAGEEGLQVGSPSCRAGCRRCRRDGCRGASQGRSQPGRPLGRVRGSSAAARPQRKASRSGTQPATISNRSARLKVR